MKKGVQGKNKVIQGLFAYVTQKLNGYKVVKKNLQKKGKK